MTSRNNDLRRHGDMRHRVHRQHKTSRPLSKDYELVGLAGEQAFAEKFKIEVDLTIRPKGSRSINFTMHGKTINVMTARKPNHLLVEQGKVKADIFVLAIYHDDTQAATLLGWASREEVLAKIPWDVGGFGIQSHAIFHTQLHPIEELEVVLGTRAVQTSLF